MSLLHVEQIARADIGYTECAGPDSGCPKRPQTPGCNHTKFGRDFGLNGYAWCAIYTWSLWTRAGYGDLIPKTAGAWDMLNRAHTKGWALPPQMPRYGDIPVYNFGDGHIGGIVTKLRAGGFAAIEANTSRGNQGSQVNGWYVAERFRTVSQLRGLIRLPIEENDMPTAAELAAALAEDDTLLNALAKRVWTVGWPDGRGGVEAAQDRLVQAARGGGLAPSIAAILSAVQSGSPVSLSQTQIGALADAVVARIGTGQARALADELARRLQA